MVQRMKRIKRILTDFLPGKKGGCFPFLEAENPLKFVSSVKIRFTILLSLRKPFIRQRFQENF
jgi:hypothetical protein